MTKLKSVNILESSLLSDGKKIIFLVAFQLDKHALHHCLYRIREQLYALAYVHDARKRLLAALGEYVLHVLLADARQQLELVHPRRNDCPFVEELNEPLLVLSYQLLYNFGQHVP